MALVWAVSFLVVGLLPASPVQADVADNATWQALLEGIKSDMALREAQLAKIRSELPALKEDLTQGLAKADNRLDQIILLRGVAGRTPWAYRTILLQFSELSDYLDLKKQPLLEKKDLLARAKREYSTIRSLRKEDKGTGYAAATQESLEAPAAAFRALKRDVEAVKDEVDASLATADGLIAEIGAAREADVQVYIDVLKEYYFEAAPGLLTGSGWESLAGDLREWANSLPRFWRPILQWVQWGDFFLYLVLYALGVTLAGRFTGVYLARRGFGSPGEFAGYRPGWRVFSVGLALVAAVEATIFTNNIVVGLMWVNCLALGLTLLTGRFLRLRGLRPETALKNQPTFVFWLLFVFGSLVEGANLPGTAVDLVWTLALVAVIRRLYRARETSQEPRERALLAMSLWIMALLIVPCLFSYGPQAMIVAQAWYMLLLTMDLCAVLKQLITGLSRIGEDGRETARSYVTLAYPFLLAVILFLYVAWILTFMGGPGFTNYVLNLNLTIGKVSVSPEAVGYVLIAFFLTRLALSWFRSFLETVSFRGRKIDAALAHTVNTVSAYALWVGFVLAAMSLFGLSLSALTWIASGLSVGIGFGLKDIVNNFISGLIIMFGGSIKKGDILQQGKNLGEVTHVSVRNTTMRTMDNTVVIIPNSSFLKGEIVNYSYQDAKMRLSIPISVVPGTKLKKVKKLLLEIAKDNPDVLKKPKPDVLFAGFSQYGLDFTFSVWIENYMQKFKIVNDLSWEIDQRFQENRISIAFRQIKTKYKPKGTEAQQLEAQREALRQKRKTVFRKTRQLRRTHARKRWNEAGFLTAAPE